MSSRLNCFWRLFVCCTIVMWSGMYLLADIPHYHGKVVLVVDRSLLADSEFINRLYRLEDDLVGDGWRVLRHEVDRGVETGSANWSTLNAPRVREVRALIKADYDADPQNVKAVFLLGHVPIPYAGDTAAISGGHQEIMCGAHPADCFYGDMTTLYGSAGWSDCLVSARANVRPQNANAKYD